MTQTVYMVCANFACPIGAIFVQDQNIVRWRICLLWCQEQEMTEVSNCQESI